MDFQALKSIQSQNSDLVSRRHSKSGELYQKGLEDLGKAIASKFKDKKKLQSAIGIFMQAIRSQRNNPEPYIALGYLFMLLNDFLSAKTYFNAVLDFDPNHADAKKFLHHIRNNISQVTKRTASIQSDIGGEIDYDQLYDSTEALIYTQLRILMAEVSYQVVYVPEKIELLEKRKLQVQSIYEQINQRITVIGKEYDVSELLVKLKPLETLYKNIEKAYLISQKMVQVTSDIQRTVEVVFQMFKQGLGDLEPIFDKCDFYADQLDELDEAGYKIKPVEKKYLQLIALIEKLQDRLDF